MNDQQISRLEARLEKLVEGMFALVFGKRLQAHDIALQLARSMEDGVIAPQAGDPRPIAPNFYSIAINPDVHRYILNRHPALTDILSSQVVELATSVGYRLNSRPIVEIIANEKIPPGHVLVKAHHVRDSYDTTAIMQPIRTSADHAAPINPQLIIASQKSVLLDQPMITIGRSHDNHIILDDPFASRYHAQVRLRFGCFTLFDADSQSGTYVNDVRVREHRLQSGDVIRIGKTSLVYMEDTPSPENPTGTIDNV
ncbi:MAG: FHA domain-containing protein [Anaerolineae bacterium]|nr:FHA domain-containing protein [Anaerolineae bacterium]